jgi:ATP-dependent DNA helicase RecQ
MPETATETLPESVTEVIERIWGHDTLRPLQARAINAALENRDALIVMPTGGGKSLCFQVPPIVAEELTIVVSPLIALIKDQVDGLVLNGYPAAGVHSGHTTEEQYEVLRAVERGEVRLLFLSPERLLQSDFLDWLKGLNDQPSGGVKRFAIDEAHCISSWGHDFRPEYRRLASLRRLFPEATVHAFTATATEKVRNDIVAQLKLNDPEILVGNFDRPNLVYRVVPRVDVGQQAIEIAARHPNDAIIVYCISRKDTEHLADVLKGAGYNAAAYHAGLKHDKRKKVQDAFTREKIDIVVATVAFGMGIDRSNVRCVLHAALPKSVEAYQQETGRAGRDGLESECILLYSAGDASRWAGLFARSAEESGESAEFLAVQLELLSEMQRFAAGMRCRHQYLCEHFGQAYPTPSCNACDVCLDENESVAEATVLAQKIISSVARVHKHSGCSFGLSYNVDVLRGSRSNRLLQRRHDTLSTYGLLKDLPKSVVVSYINQLIDQGVLEQTRTEFPLLTLTQDSLATLKGEWEITLRAPKMPTEHKVVVEEITLSEEEHLLFDALRELRRDMAEERGVPPYVVFPDTTLKELAAVRPSSLDLFILVNGVGTLKRDTFGQAFIDAIKSWCELHNLDLDAREPMGKPPKSRKPSSGPPTPSLRRKKAHAVFEHGQPVESAIEVTGLAPRTVWNYLGDWIEETAPESVSNWVSDTEYERVKAAVEQVGCDFLKPIREHLEEEISYEHIRVVVAHLRATGQVA